MRLTTAFAMMLLTGAAHAAGGVSCEGTGQGVSFAFHGGASRGMGGALFSFEGSVTIKSTKIAKDLRRVSFGKEHVAQYAVDRNYLVLVLYRERTGNNPHGYVELSVQTKPAGEEGTFAGRYNLTVFDTAGDTWGSGKRVDSQGKVTCFME